jgi:putative transposon-encoded protein
MNVVIKMVKLKVEDIGLIDNVEGVHYSFIVKVGNGAMAKSYKKYLGKEAIVIVLQEDPRKKIKFTKKQIKERNKEFKDEFD